MNVLPICGLDMSHFYCFSVKGSASIYIPRIQEKTDPHPKDRFPSYKDTVELREGVLTLLAGELS